MPKTTFTNADLVPRRGERGFQEPQDVLGEWHSDPTSQLAQMSANSDVNSGQSVDDILAGVKATLAQGDRRNLEASGRTPVERPNAIHEYLDDLGGRAMGGVLPLAAMSGGPLGMAAGGVLTGQSAMDFVEDPSLVGGVFTGLGALPFVKPIQRLLKGGKAAARAARVSQELPYRMEGRVGPFPQKPLPVSSAPETSTITRLGQADQDVVSTVDRGMKNIPAPAVTHVDELTGLSDVSPEIRAITDEMTAPAWMRQAAVESPAVDDSMAALEQAAGGGRITNPGRMLPAFGETSVGAARTAGRQLKRSGQTLLELVNEKLQQVLPGGRVLGLKKYPMPSGTSELDKAIRQRGHIAGIK